MYINIYKVFTLIYKSSQILDTARGKNSKIQDKVSGSRKRQKRTKNVNDLNIIIK